MPRFPGKNYSDIVERTIENRTRPPEEQKVLLIANFALAVIRIFKRGVVPRFPDKKYSDNMERTIETAA